MRTLKLLLAAGLLVSSMNGFAQDITGDWQGTLEAGVAELRLVLHVTKSPDGSLHATLDSVDQASYGIPVTSVSLKGDKLNLALESIHGSYSGTVAADAKHISGTWSQGQPLPLDWTRAPAPVKSLNKPSKPSDIDGAWAGTIDAGAIKLRVIFHIINTDDGLVATLDSPDQNVNGIPATAVKRDTSSLTIEVKSIGGVFQGQIAKDLNTISGTWTQAGNTTPLTVTRVKNAAELERPRPQVPKKPYPYHDEEVQYTNAKAGITLAGTLTIPQGKGPFSAAVLITGSGPQDRDESLMGHKPFLILADYLTRKGIAVLRSDDRGFGKSGGVFATATSADFATDAEAGIAFLKTRDEINPRKIGLIGHSEGGLIAAVLAAHDRDVAFIVMLAGPGVPGDQILPEQTRLISQVAGEAPEKIDKDVQQERESLALVEKELDNAKLEQQLRAKLNGKIPDAQLGASIKQLTSPWMRYFLTYDPATALRKVKCPVLALNGSKDLQVPPRQNLPPIRNALKEAGNSDFEVDEMPGLNHLFQHAKTGLPAEYGEIEETMSPEVLEKVAGWIIAATNSPVGGAAR
jgi:pimeloyl-ACP methyl ester carboxylesterase